MARVYLNFFPLSVPGLRIWRIRIKCLYVFSSLSIRTYTKLRKLVGNRAHLHLVWLLQCQYFTKPFIHLNISRKLYSHLAVVYYEWPSLCSSAICKYLHSLIYHMVITSILLNTALWASSYHHTHHQRWQLLFYVILVLFTFCRH